MPDEQRPASSSLWRFLARHPWVTDVVCPIVATVAGVGFGAYLTTDPYGVYDLLLVPLALSIAVPYRVHAVARADRAAAVRRAVTSVRRESLANVRIATHRLLETLLMALAFPGAWGESDLRAYCHRAYGSFLYPFAWAGVHRESDVHQPIPCGTEEAIRVFAIAEAFATGSFVIRDRIVRSELEESMKIPPYACVIAAPIRMGKRTLGTLSLGSFRTARAVRLDRVEAKDALMTMADAIYDLWRGLDDAFEAHLAGWRQNGGVVRGRT